MEAGTGNAESIDELADDKAAGSGESTRRLVGPQRKDTTMATALEVLPQAATCDHLAFNPYETVGGGTDPNILELGKCCSCQEWLACDTDLMTGTTTYTPLDAATILRLIREAEHEMEEFFV